jgi:hypothetical protein
MNGEKMGMGMGSFSVPVRKRELLTLGNRFGGTEEEKVRRGIGILRPHLKSNLSISDEAALRSIVVRQRYEIRKKWVECKRKVEKFESKYGSWLNTQVHVPISLLLEVRAGGRCSNCLAALRVDAGNAKGATAKTSQTPAQLELGVSRAFEIVFEGFLKENVQVSFYFGSDLL